MSDLKKPSSTAPIDPKQSQGTMIDEENLNLQAPSFERILQNNYHQQREQEEEKACRICLESDSPQTMIAPCLCKGGSKWVHRECLDEWRTHEKDRAFSKCTECLFEYHLQQQPVEGSVSCCKPPNRRRLLFYWMVSRDACLGIVLQQLIIVALAALILACDPNHKLQELWLQTIMGSTTSSSQSTTTIVLWIYYALGWFAFFIGLGLYGSIVVCMNGCDVGRSIPRVGPPSEVDQEEPAAQTAPRSPLVNSTLPTAESSSSSPNQYTYSPMDRDSDGPYHHIPHTPRTTTSSTTFYRRRRHYHRRRYYSNNDYYCGPTYYPMYVYQGNDDCCCWCCCCDSGTHHSDGCFRGCGHLAGSAIHGGSSSNSSGSSNGDGQHILLLVLLVVAIILAIVGFFVGVVVVVVASQRIISRHIYLLQKRQLVQEFKVVDLQDYDLDNRIDSDSDSAAAAAGENNDPNGIEMLQAPTMPTEDVQYLQKLGLMDHYR